MTRKIFSLLVFGAGIFLLVQVIMPFISYKIWEETTYRENIALINPSPSTQVLGISIKDVDSFPAFVSSNTRQTKPQYKEFTVTIPRIKLENIKGVIDSNNFDNNLSHLPGSALPGEKGNAFITGHSSLPQLFNTNNYKTIFTNLPKVKKGDEVIVEAGGQRFVYVVKGLRVVNPTETWVIDPPDTNGRYLTLMTCVPPGLYLKRLIVLAELKS